MEIQITAGSYNVDHADMSSTTYLVGSAVVVVLVILCILAVRLRTRHQGPSAEDQARAKAAEIRQMHDDAKLKGKPDSRQG